MKTYTATYNKYDDNWCLVLVDKKKILLTAQCSSCPRLMNVVATYLGLKPNCYRYQVENDQKSNIIIEKYTLKEEL